RDLLQGKATDTEGDALEACRQAGDSEGPGRLVGVPLEERGRTTVTTGEGTAEAWSKRVRLRCSDREAARRRTDGEEPVLATPAVGRSSRRCLTTVVVGSTPRLVDRKRGRGRCDLRGTRVRRPLDRYCPGRASAQALESEAVVVGRVQN